MPGGNGSAPDRQRAARPAAIWGALAAVYVVWGSTYLAIRVAVETLPPLLMASVRFLIAGGILYAWAISRGERGGDRPTASQWRAAAIIGTPLLLGGNGAVVLAEQTVPSGIAALLVATVPLWMVVLARVVLGERVTWRESLGIAVGFGGIVLLVSPTTGGGFDPLGVGLLLFASLSWAAGSLYARRAPMPSRPLVGTAMQMLAGGAALGIAGIAAGEVADVDLARASMASLLGLGYLIVFGSLVGFTAYVWLLRVTRTSLVSTYAYVNPVVAVLLGWAVVSEPLTIRTLVAGGVIVIGVALIVSVRARRPAERPAGEPSGEPPGSGAELRETRARS
ncbi:MAG: drug/metabolite exporter YedA [Actinomycetota bacterium]